MTTEKRGRRRSWKRWLLRAAVAMLAVVLFVGVLAANVMAIDDRLFLRQTGIAADIVVQHLSALGMRLGGFTDDRTDWCATYMQVILPGLTHGPEDVAAPVGLVTDQASIFSQLWPVVETADRGLQEKSDLCLSRCRRGAIPLVRGE